MKAQYWRKGNQIGDFTRPGLLGVLKTYPSINRAKHDSRVVYQAGKLGQGILTVVRGRK